MANVRTTLPEDKSKLPVVQAYELHFKDILRIRQEHERKTGERTDISRLDSMTAVRMRATGFTQKAVRDAIEQMAPKIREALGEPTDAHNWHDYAVRTASYAFGHEGRRSMDKQAKYIEHWKKMEREADRPKALTKIQMQEKLRDDGWER